MPNGVPQTITRCVMIALALVAAGGCSSTSRKEHTPGGGGPASTAASAETYQRACEQEGDVCIPGVSGALPARLVRPLHFPHVERAHCPGSRARYVSTPDFGSVALGTGPVRIGVDTTVAHGAARAGSTGYPGWLGLKTHFFSVPSYQGPFLVRAARLDGPGLVRLGATPAQSAPLVVPPGPTVNGSAGWREVPYFTFMAAPGCYGWQIDGLKFSEMIVIRLLSPPGK